MKPRLLATAAVLGIAAGAVLLPAARAEQEHGRHAAPHAVGESGDASRRPVRVVAIEHPTWGRLTFLLEDNPRPAITHYPDGVELRFAPGTTVTAPATERLRQVADIEVKDANGAPDALVRLACDCTVTTEAVGHLLRLDIRENPSGHGKPEASGGPTLAEMEKLRNTLAEKLALLNGAPLPGQAPGAGAPAKPGAAAPPATPPAPPQVCLPTVDMSHWRNRQGFMHQLADLRADVAYSRAAPRYLAALAEFYLAYGLGGEALAAASDGFNGDESNGDVTPDDRIRLTRDADIAHLLLGEQLDAGAPLLASPPGCQRADAALWRALAAAAANDPVGAARDASGAAQALRHVPQPLLQRLAYRIAGAIRNDRAALLAMAGAVASTTDEVPEDEADRFLLQARIAQEANDQADYAVFLARAARDVRTVPGLIAKERLEALRVSQNGPDTGHAEAVLADIARTYRHDALGQHAAQAYAQSRMRHGDYVAALAMADESASPDGPKGGRNDTSAGAVLAARILRILLVDPGADRLLTPAERIAQFWRYQGYATPGAAGDDIRLGAARLMLTERLPEAALVVLKQLAPDTAARPHVGLMRAQSEAEAGDPAVALSLLQSLPASDAVRRVTAIALEHAGHFTEAAHQLDGAKTLADQAFRAGLLFKAAAWPDAATAYAAVLHAPGVNGALKTEAAERYALALTLAGEPAPKDSAAMPADSLRLLAALPAQAQGPSRDSDVLGALRTTLERSKRVEELLGPAPANRGS